ncbi:MAG: hypothetical protein WCI05_17615, partial [Myxococcales bacterium]
PYRVESMWPCSPSTLLSLGAQGECRRAGISSPLRSSYLKRATRSWSWIQKAMGRGATAC